MWNVRELTPSVFQTTWKETGKELLVVLMFSSASWSLPSSTLFFPFSEMIFQPRNGINKLEDHGNLGECFHHPHFTRFILTAMSRLSKGSCAERSSLEAELWLWSILGSFNFNVDNWSFQKFGPSISIWHGRGYKRDMADTPLLFNASTIFDNVKRTRDVGLVAMSLLLNDEQTRRKRSLFQVEGVNYSIFLDGCLHPSSVCLSVCPSSKVYT